MNLITSMKKLLKILLGLIIFFGLVAVVLFFFVRLEYWISGLTTSQKPAFIGAAALLLVPIVTYFTTKSIEHRQSIDTVTFKKRVEIYEDFVKYQMSVMMKKDPKNPPEDPVDFSRRVTPMLVTHASNKVIKLWGHFRLDIVDINKRGDMKEFIRKLEDLLKAMRKDLGHNSLSIQDGDIARLFINDVDEVLGKSKQRNDS